MKIERDIRISRLGNGLSVVTDHLPQLATVTCGVWIGAGNRYEAPEVNGVAHMLEHMLFKGTARRTARQIADAVEAVGGHLNAYTGRETTAYYARVLKDDVPLAVDVLADILQHAEFAEEELSRERQVVLSEIGQTNDTPDDIIFDHFQETAYPGQALGRPVLGPAEIVAAMPRRAMTDYLGAHYRGDRMVLAAAGHVDHDRLVALAGRHFADLPAGRGPVAEAASYRGGDFRKADDLEQLHLVLGFGGVSYHDDDFYAQAVLSNLLGGGMSSRLFQEVREKRGLAYSIYSFNAHYTDHGMLCIYAGTGEKDAGELVPVVCGELAGLADSLAESELARARAQLKSGQLMALESTMARADRLGQQLLIFGRPRAIEEVTAAIDAVDVAAVRRVIGRLLASPLTLAALGRVAGLESYDAIRGRLAAA